LKQLLKDYKRIVIKIGSSLFCTQGQELDLSLVAKIAGQIYLLVKSGREIVIVSSGAIALGMHKLGLEERPKELSRLSASAAIGQNELMNAYSRFFGERLHAAQILLTWEDFDDRRRYLNAKNTLFALLNLGNVVPIINENDSISTEEIRFGDNDNLSARVASLISADLLIMLSDVDGLLDRDKKVIRVVDEITPQIKALACPTKKKTCVGGMVTKIEAATIAMGSGIPCVIANGRREDIILSVIKEPEKQGTLFVPKQRLAAKQRWLAFGTKSKGRIFVDEGAKRALINKKSLLSVGVAAVEGDFLAGDIVSVRDKQDCEFGRGKVGLCAKDLNKVKGSRSDREVIHRDNIVIL
jgi:glutamate 5-kinase